VGITGGAISVISLGFAFWQKHNAKRKGDLLTTFLIGLKSADLPPKAIGQVNDMLERLK
jgi:hypothetical protein